MARRVRQWIGFLIMLAGLGLLAGPFLLGIRGEKLQEQVVDSFYQELKKEDTVPEKLPETQNQPETQTLLPEEPQDAFYQAAKAYNESLLRDGQETMSSRADVEQFALSALDYGAAENIIGTIQIPRMEIELGLYLGATAENMAKGAAIFGMTSLPLGRESENVAIAGHRGWQGTPMFREIQKLQMDDPIYITTPWQTLVYRVCEIRIVSPEDSSWCKIQQGESLITLMTCHPYGQNYQRYIVFARLCQEEKPSAEEMMENNLQSYDPTPREVTLVHSDGTRETVAVDPATIQPDGSEYGSVLSNFVILAEDTMGLAAWIFAALVAVTGIWLTILTLRDFQESRRRTGRSQQNDRRKQHDQSE